MDNRSNTIAGWTLGGLMVALGLSIVTEGIFKSETPEEGKQGYAIQGVESGGGAAAAAVIPLPNLLASADVAKGEGAFKKCTACHTINQGGANGIGPNLWGIMSHGIAKNGSFAYSDALKSKGGNWTFEAMDEWLTSPKKFANGTKMTFAGLGNPEERAALLLYLNSQGANLPLPAPVEVAAPEADDAAAEGQEAAEQVAATAEGETPQ